MIPIHKKNSPPLLITEKQTLIAGNNGELPKCSYKNLGSEAKLTIQQALLEEQGYLCAYCMGRISTDLDDNGQPKMRIEHFACQSAYPDKQLDYDNMLGVCCGNTSPEQHCDSSKGNQSILYNPSQKPNYSKLKILYSSYDGEIRSEDTQFNQEINDVLNLNHQQIKSNRLSALTGVQKALEKQFGGKGATRETLTFLLEKWKNIDTNGKKKPYCGIVIYYLDKKISRL